MREGFKEMSAKQEDLIETAKEAREDIVDEVAGLRSDLKGAWKSSCRALTYT